MNMRQPTPGSAPRRGSVRERVKALADSGLEAADIRAQLESEGASPSTIDAYLNVFCPAEGHWAAQAAEACDLHLADLAREHGSQVRA